MSARQSIFKEEEEEEEWMEEEGRGRQKMWCAMEKPKHVARSWCWSWVPAAAYSLFPLYFLVVHIVIPHLCFVGLTVSSIGMAL